MEEQFRTEYPSRSELLQRWSRAGGEEAFDRAVERAREILR